MLRVAAYCRVSTDKLDQANSFENQQKFFKDYIEHKEGWVLFGIYADEGLSGTSTKKRTSFNRMISDAKKGLFDLIITKEVSRFSRNIVDTVIFTRELKKNGVGVIFANDGINTLDADSELRLSIMGSIAQEESRKISSRVKWGQTRQMEKGVVFGRSMLGYDIKNGILKLNEEGASTVRLIFEKYVDENKGVYIISKELKKEGIKTYTGKTDWTAATVLKILKNEKYAGDLLQKKTYTPDYLTHEKKYNKGQEEVVLIKNHHQAIVDREKWERVQKELKRRCVKSNKCGRGNRFLFSGKIFCGNCGSAFVARSRSRLDGTIYRFWRCFKSCGVRRQLGNSFCYEVLRSAILYAIKDREKIALELLNTIKSVFEKRTQFEKNALEKLLKKESELLEKKKSVFDAYFSKLISCDEMRHMIDKYDSEVAEIKRKQVFLEDPVKTNIPQILLLKINDIINLNDVSDCFYLSLLIKITVFNEKVVVCLKHCSDRITCCVEKQGGKLKLCGVHYENDVPTSVSIPTHSL